MKIVLIAVLLQSPLQLPPRAALDNPASVSTVPEKARKDYDKLWNRFLAGRDDVKLAKDIDKFVKKRKTFDTGLVIGAYLDMYRGDDNAARQKLTETLKVDPDNKIALYYLGELAFAHKEYARAANLYAQVLAADRSRIDLETKQQTAYLLATEDLLRSAAKAEADNRLADAERLYRQSLTIAPNDPTLHTRLADLLDKANKKEEAVAERKIVEELTPHHAANLSTPVEPIRDDLEDLGRWGNDIEVFHRIRSAETITREQLAVLIVRYFPQIAELLSRPQIITDIQESSARSEILTVAGLRLIEPFPNHSFGPTIPVARADLATALARLSRLLGLSGDQAPPLTAPDVAPTNAGYRDIQLVLGYGLMNVQDSGSFNVSGYVSGREAVYSADQLLHTFQQAQR